MAVAGDNQIKGIRLYLFVYLILRVKPAVSPRLQRPLPQAKAAKHKSFFIALENLS